MPSAAPTVAPIDEATPAPSGEPAAEPTYEPTPKPSAEPGEEPTSKPTPLPTKTPTAVSSPEPTADSVSTPLPTREPQQKTALVIQENDDGFCRIDGSVEANYSGYTGEGYTTSDTATGSSIIWMLDVESSNSYVLKFRYANHSGNDLAAFLSNNGIPQGTGDFAATGAWDSWNEESIMVNLDEGLNRLVLTANVSEGLANIDSLTINGRGLTPASCFQVSNEAANEATIPPTPGPDSTSAITE